MPDYADGSVDRRGNPADRRIQTCSKPTTVRMTASSHYAAVALSPDAMTLFIVGERRAIADALHDTRRVLIAGHSPASIRGDASTPQRSMTRRLRHAPTDRHRAALEADDATRRDRRN